GGGTGVRLPSSFPISQSAGELMKFTVDSIAKLTLPADKDDHTESDDDIPGWAFRLRRRKRRTAKYWAFQYTVGEAIEPDDPTKRKRKKQRKLTFGRYPAMGVPEAREKAAKFHAEVMLGGDPQALKEENQARAGETFEACVELYLEWRRSDPKKTLRPSTL